MTLKPGTMLGPYEILSLIGAGGMGEVYKARDTRLERIVAIKVLPAHLALNPDLRERFEREARAIANLQHPNICVLHDIGQQDGIPVPQGGTGRVHYLVMEYLDGETAAQRLLKDPLPLEQVLQYAIQISDALEKAHRQGYTHRDIKPGNIMLTKGGSKILDFGLAKFKQEAAQPNLPQSQIPTAPSGLTEKGTIMGTLQYMSPEQVEGKVDELDGRTDIFAFGAVVYEMITGKKAFPGNSQASVIGAIMKEDPPPMSSLQPMTPPSLGRVVKRCLAKEPEKRWQSANDLCDELNWIAQGSGQTALPLATAPKVLGVLSRRALLWGTASLLLAVLTGIAVWYLKPAPPAAQAPAHLVVALPPGDQLAGQLALSPDGAHLAYVATHNGVQQLFLRAMDSQEAGAIADTEGAQNTPFFSPDGQWIGFHAGGKLKKVSIHGGASLNICDAPGVIGASWGMDDTILFAPTLASGLWRVSASGGTPEVLTTPDRSKGEVSHRWPQFLPGGKAVLFTATSGPGWDEYRTVAQVLDTGERRVLVQGAMGRYVPTGHLVYYREGTLLAVPFDPVRLEVTGRAPVTVAEGVLGEEGTGGTYYAFSSGGSLAYIPASPRQFEHRLVWVDRKGGVEPLPVPTRRYRELSFSPDGRQVALNITWDTAEVWIYDLARNTLTRLSAEGENSQVPIWTPDGKRVTYRGNRAGFRNVFWRLADGAGSEERLAPSENIQTPGSWSPDGKLLAFVDRSPSTRDDIWLLRLEGERQAKPFLQTAFDEGLPIFSPDGRWLAYQSNESGRNEVYVQPFPGPGGKWRISTDGGSVPMWAPNGRELFYRSGDKMMAADITTSPTFSAGKPRLLFEGRFIIAGYAPSYDVAPDGRFLMIQRVEPEQPATQIHVVLNWFEELRRKAPVQ